MNQFKFKDGDVPHVRIDKRAARIAFNAGKPVVFCPKNFAPFGGFRPSVMVQKSEHGRDFDEAVRDFEWFNCTDSETGKYAAFYIKEESK